jgi:hypothetical protein
MLCMLMFVLYFTLGLIPTASMISFRVHLFDTMGLAPEVVRACNSFLPRTCPHNVIKIFLVASMACPHWLVRLYNARGLPQFLSCLMQLSHIHAYALCSIQYNFRFHDHALDKQYSYKTVNNSICQFLNLNPNNIRQ